MNEQGMKLGALYAIPGSDVFGLAKVIFISSHYKNLMLIRMFKLRAKQPEEFSAPDINGDSTLYYTGVDSVSRGHWIYLGQQEVSQSERAMSKRISGGEVWIEDVHIGSASETDFQSLKNMDVYGYRLIEKAVNRG